MISRPNYLVVNDRHKLGKSCVQICNDRRLAFDASKIRRTKKKTLRQGLLSHVQQDNRFGPYLGNKLPSKPPNPLVDGRAIHHELS
jgi:hypothetical protein